MPLDQFGVSDSQFQRAVGSKGLYQLQTLRDWVFGRQNNWPCENWVCRYAPSVIARSEAELFGVSMPRFAMRVYLDEEGQNLVNARRIGEFAANAREWGKRQAKREDRLPDVRLKWLAKFATRPAGTIRKNTCVGDCLLQFQERAGWHVLEEELGLAYGEGRTIEGTPYVKHISLPGGGLCAQASSFMATALLHRYCLGVYGVPEVTALAAEPLPDPTKTAPVEESAPAVSEMILTGLFPAQMLRYFQHDVVGLRATKQTPTRNQDLGLNVPFERALAAYLRSGMPVILPLDFGRMAGLGHGHDKLKLTHKDSIFGNQTPYQIPQQVVPDQQRGHALYHAVVLVGCSEQGGNFLLNDPCTYPFLRVCTEDIVQAACYTNTKMEELAKRVFVPVTPAAVKLPLECYQEPCNAALGLGLTGSQDGLVYMARSLGRKWGPRGAPKSSWPGQFRLLQARELSSCQLVRPDALGELDGALGRWTDAHADHWCWLQVTEDSLWVWDAQKPPPARERFDEDLEKHLLCGLTRKGGKWSVAIRRPAEVDRERPPNAPAPKGPFGRCSLISSFRVKSCKEIIARWPDRSVDCDLYCFMQADAKGPGGFSFGLLRRGLLWAWWWTTYTVPYRAMNWWRAWAPFRTSSHYRFPGIRRYSKADPGERLSFPVAQPVLTAVDTMAMSARRKHPAARAREIDERLRGAGIKCVALTSYVPEIIASKGRARTRAQRALQYLVLLAKELGKLGHPVCTLEIVAGSLVDGVWPARWRMPQESMEGWSALAPEEVEHLQAVNCLRGRDAGRRREVEDVYVANCLSPEEALTRLLEALKPVAATIREENMRLGLAIELEPGPLYAVQNLKSLRRLCEKLSEDEKLGGVVGLNLDVAHWILSRVEFEPGDSELIVPRILHAHVSDHGHGHLGDVEVGAIHDYPSHFSPWLALAHEAAQMQDSGLPPKSGYVSIELEACKELDMISRSVQFLRNQNLVD